MSTQRTLILVKPDGVRRGLIGEVVSRIERKGLTISRLELRAISRETAESVEVALEQARGVAADNDVVVVTGSLYTVGAARGALGLDPA